MLKKSLWNRSFTFHTARGQKSFFFCCSDCPFVCSSQNHMIFLFRLPRAFTRNTLTTPDSRNHWGSQKISTSFTLDARRLFQFHFFSSSFLNAKIPYKCDRLKSLSKGYRRIEYIRDLYVLSVLLLIDHDLGRTRKKCSL